MLAFALDQELALLLPLPVIYMANLAVDPDRSESTRRSFGRVIAACIGALALALLLSAVAALSSSPLYALITLITALVVASLSSVRTRFICGALGMDPKNTLHALAAALTVLLLGTQLAAQFAGNALAQEARSGVALTPLALLAQEVPFLLAALLGVGLLSRRGPRATAERLGWVRPTPSQLALGLVAAIVFFGLGSGADWLSSRLTPDLAREVAAANGRLFGGLDSPLGIATVALAAGVCEEALFRGALQPRIGLVLTSLVFALLHSQYGLSIDTMAVFVLAIGLGLLRRFANTTTSTLTHVVYNTLVGVGGGLPLPIVATAVLPLAALAWVARDRSGTHIGSDGRGKKGVGGRPGQD
ncbi:MAG TPA: CPBP family intramembrane glutamic endopeptidase [Candidatus Nitrosotalea sp.]|nr:CPBP family intramembrane glutamic endopeptidase [Candidatus Nitrosotalea sp.]